MGLAVTYLCRRLVQVLSKRGLFFIPIPYTDTMVHYIASVAVPSASHTLPFFVFVLAVFGRRASSPEEALAEGVA